MRITLIGEHEDWEATNKTGKFVPSRADGKVKVVFEADDLNTILDNVSAFLKACTFQFDELEVINKDENKGD